MTTMIMTDPLAAADPGLAEQVIWEALQGAHVITSLGDQFKDRRANLAAGIYWWTTRSLTERDLSMSRLVLLDVTRRVYRRELPPMTDDVVAFVTALEARYDDLMRRSQS